MSSTKAMAGAVEAVAIFWSRTAQGISSEDRISLGKGLEWDLQQSVAAGAGIPKLAVSEGGQMSEMLQGYVKILEGLSWPVQATQVRFWKDGAEVLSRGLPGSPYNVLYPSLHEAASGTSMATLSSALNGAVGKYRPWVLLRRQAFIHAEFGNMESDANRDTWDLWQSDPAEFWKRKGVTEAAMANFRPDDLLVGGFLEGEVNAEWMILGAPL